MNFQPLFKNNFQNFETTTCRSRERGRRGGGEMEEGDDENINTLLCMGFPDVAEIKRALRLAKNDLNEAVAILTNEQPLSSYGTVDDLSLDVDMKYQVKTFTRKNI